MLWHQQKETSLTSGEGKAANWDPRFLCTASFANLYHCRCGRESTSCPVAGSFTQLCAASCSDKVLLCLVPLAMGSRAVCQPREFVMLMCDFAVMTEWKGNGYGTLPHLPSATFCFCPRAGRHLSLPSFGIYLRFESGYRLRI